MQRSQIRDLVCGTAVSGLVLLSGCGSNSTSTSPGMVFNILSVPGISSAVTYSFDLGAFDPATNKYYVTDRTNRAIDVVDLNNGMAVTQFKPTGAGALAGCAGTEYSAPNATRADNVPIPTCTNTSGANASGTSAPGTVYPMFFVQNDQSGPDGVDVVGNTLFVGDVNKLVVLNKTTGAVIGTISIPNAPTALRADEGCFDPVNHLYAISTPGAANPYMTILDTTNAEANPPTTPTVIATLIMNDSTSAASGGLEACVFDTAVGGTNKLFVNNDGSTANPNGEIDGIPVSNLVALKVGAPHTGAGAVVFAGTGNSMGATAGTVLPLPALCDPTGIALGPNPEIGAMCRPGTIGQRMDFVILNKSTGANIATVAGAGGGDQITYDVGSGNWFLATSRATATNNSCGGGSAACVLTPMLTVVNGASHTVAARVPSGNNSHSVFTGGGLVFSPFTNGPSATAGGVGFPNGGIAVFFTQ